MQSSSTVPSPLASPEAREDLNRYAEAGGFTLRAETHPWYAAFASVSRLDEARAASSILAELRGHNVPDLQQAAERLASVPGFDAPTTVRETATLVSLLARVRATLEVLHPDTYLTEAHTLDALLAATATPAWRAERGVSQSWWQRTLLARRARGLAAARGARREDLHTALAEAAATRSKWVSLATTGTRPTLPSDAGFLDTAVPAAEAALTGLDELTALLGRKVSLTALPFEALTDLLDRLASDEGTLYRLPRLRELHDTLTAQGLTDLLAQLTEEQADVKTTAALIAQRTALDAAPAAKPTAADAATVADADAEAEPTAEADAALSAEAAPEPATEAQPEADAEPEPLAQAELVADAEAEAIADTTTEPIAEAQPEADAEAAPEAIAEAKAIADTTTEPIAEAQPEADAEAEPVAQAEPAAETVAEAETVADSLLEAESAPEGEAVLPEAEPVAGALLDTGLVSEESALSAAPEVDAEAEPVAEAAPEAIAEAEAIADATTEPVAEVQPEADAEAEPVAQAEPAAEAVAEAEPVADSLLEAESAPEGEAGLPDAAGAAEAEPVAGALLDTGLAPEVDAEAESIVTDAPDADPASEAEPVADVLPDTGLASEDEAPAAEARTRPDVVAGKPVTAYSAEQLEAIVRWIDADGVERSDEELLRAGMKELGFSRLGPRIKEALGAAVAAARG
ncbi:hypothetical protein [Streptacidiphilus pinicola]|uniref:hypothetical protein n=1 Tax=Streptacidiphilus pinicola TaxID=2219663 RepID=UPI001403A9BB|nr:hypothetical protein [Streptacidiphilus pinicola]